MLWPMRPPAKIKPWLSLPQLTEWVCAASADANLLRQRLVVWLMALQPAHARQVAALLGVSVVSVWRWVGRYNRGGPGALRARAPRGPPSRPLRRPGQGSQRLGRFGAPGLSGGSAHGRAAAPSLGASGRPSAAHQYPLRLAGATGLAQAGPAAAPSAHHARSLGGV
jgi:hypothetical protein